MDRRNISVGLRIAIVIGIAFLYPATIYYGVATFVERPEFPSWTGPGPSASDEQRQKAREEREAQMKTYEQKMEIFSRSLFWVAIPLGLIAIGLGLNRRLADISTGFMFAGIFTIGEGHLGAWRYITDELRFASFLIGLALLLFVSYRRIFAKAE